MPGCVGTTFQHSASSSSSRRTLWTIVAVASAGPVPLSWRSEANGIPETLAVAGGFADEEESDARSFPEVFTQPAAPLGRSLAVSVEVERPSDPRRGETSHEPFRIHGVTMLMPVKGRIAAVVAACGGVCVPVAHAAPPQGVQSDAAFAASYVQRGVTSVPATTQRVSCYTPEVSYDGSVLPGLGFPDGGSTPCAGAATTGENIGPYATQDVANAPLRAKDFSESDLHVDPANPRHLIGVSKWIVNSEGYNHLTGFFESFDGGATWPQLGHVPGYEGWTDNSDPAGAFDPWGNFYVVVLPYMFSYASDGSHGFLADNVNPTLPRSGIGVAVRPKGAATADAWNVVPSIENVLTPIPPLAPAVIVPVPPKQFGFVGVAVATTWLGVMFVAVAVPVQPLASLAVTV